MDNRPLHRVSCKAAIYSPNGDKVLVMKYTFPDGVTGFGLPGGHMEDGELPEEALSRELIEEIGEGFSLALQRRDFWVHEDGKVVLGYVGTVTDEVLPPPLDPQAIAQWALIEDIERGDIDTGSYTTFIITNRPQA